MEQFHYLPGSAQIYPLHTDSPSNLVENPDDPDDNRGFYFLYWFWLTLIFDLDIWPLTLTLIYFVR